MAEDSELVDQTFPSSQEHKNVAVCVCVFFFGGGGCFRSFISRQAGQGFLFLYWCSYIMTDII